jgi:hypothetical protein
MSEVKHLKENKMFFSIAKLLFLFYRFRYTVRYI